MSKWTDTNFESNQAIVVSYHPVNFQIDRQKRLRVRVQKWNFNMIATLFFPNSTNSETLGGALPPCKFQINLLKHL